MAIHFTLPLQIIYYLKSIKLSNLFSENISFAEFMMLQLITDLQAEKGKEGVWVSDIVKRVEFTPQAVSKFLQLAAGKGFIERLENAGDRRSVEIQITSRGREVLSQSGEELCAFHDTVLQEFSEEELALMSSLTSKLQTAVQNNYLKHKKK